MKRLLIILITMLILSSWYAPAIFAATDTNTEKVNSTLETARRLVSFKKYDNAIKFYLKALAEEPENADLLIEIARVYGWKDDHDNSIKYYQQAIKAAPQRKDDVLRSLGWQLFWDNRVNEALNIFQDYLSRHPDDVEAKRGFLETFTRKYLKQREQARQLVDNKQYKKALDIYTILLRNNKYDSDLIIEAAKVYALNHQPAEAISLYKKVIADNPQRKDDIIPYLAWQLIAENNYDEAKLLLEDYLKHYPDNADAAKALAVAQNPKSLNQLTEARQFVNEEKYSQALTIYQSLLDKKPNDVDLLIEVARVYGFANQHAKAINLYKKVIQLAPDRKDDVSVALAWQLIKDNENNEAAEYLNDYLTRHPDNQEAINALAASKIPGGGEISKEYELLSNARRLVDEKKYSQALFDYHKLLQKKPNNSDLLIEIARVYAWADDHNNSIKYYQYLIQFAPQRKDDVIPSLAWQLIWNHQSQEAIPLLKDYLTRHPQNEDALKALAEAQNYKINEPLDLARTLTNQKKYSEALTIYNNLIKNNPNNIDLLIETARVYGWADQHTPAIQMYQQILKIAPDRTDDILIPLAWQLIWNNQANLATPYLNDYLSRHPKDSEALKALATKQQGPPQLAVPNLFVNKENLERQQALELPRQLVNENKYKEALIEYHKYLAKVPNDSDLLIEIARVYSWLDDHKNSIKIYKRALAVAPQRKDDIIPSLAWQLIWNNQFTEAIPYLQDYLSRHPKDDEALKAYKNAQNNLLLLTARNLVEKKNHPQALIYYQKLLTLNPNDTDLLIETARVYDLNKQYALAINLYQKVIQANPKRRDDVLRSLGWSNLALNQFNIAIYYFSQYLLHHPNDQDAANGFFQAKLGLARYYVDQKNNPKALIIYNELLQIKPHDADLLIETARVNGWEGNHELAIQLYQRVIRVAPQRTDDVLRPIGWQYISLDKPDIALIYFENYLTNHLNDVDALLGIARIHEEKNQNLRALNLYQAIVFIAPNNIEARLGEARMQLFLNRFGLAEQDYLQILQMDPNNFEAQSGLVRVHNWRGLNRLAVREYRELVARYPDNESLKIDLAVAQYWAGFDDHALKTLNGISGKSASYWRNKIIRDYGHPIGADYFNSSDSDGLVINSYRFNAGYRYSDTGVLGGEYRIANFREIGERIINHEEWLTWTDRFGSVDSTWGTHWPYLAFGRRTYGDWAPYGWRVRDKWIPTDLWRITFNAQNEVIENIPSIENHVIFTSASGGFSYNPAPRVWFDSGGAVGEFNDGNVRERQVNRLQYTLFYTPRITIAVDTNYFTDSKPEIDRGYYNPAIYREVFTVFGLSHNVDNWDFGGKAAIGRFQENPGNPGDLNYYELFLARDFGRFGYLRFYYGRSRSQPNTSAPANFGPGYSRRYLGLIYYSSLQSLWRLVNQELPQPYL